MSERKILFLIPVLKDGSGKFLTFLSKGLLIKGWKVGVASASRSGDWREWPELKKELLESGASVYEIDFFNRSSSSFWREVDKLTRLLREEKFSILAPQSCVPAAACVIARDLLKLDIPIILTFHSWGTGRPYWMNLWDNWALLKVDHICFVSYGYREAFLRSLLYPLSADRTSVIHPGLYINDNYPSKEELRRVLSQEYNVPEEAFWISSLGGISERKGTLELVQAFSLFFKEGADAYLFLVGPVREEDYFRKVKEASLKTAGRVKILGYLEDPYPLIKASDLFVFPSKSEGLGSALMEAMVLGVPCASTDIEGLRDLVCGGEYAIIIREISPEGILKALKEAFENPDRSCKIGRLARERIVRDFSFTKTVEEYEKLYSQFLMRRFVNG